MKHFTYIPDLLCKLLRALQEAPKKELLLQPTIEGYSNADVSYHLEQMRKDGYITAPDPAEGDDEPPEFAYIQLSTLGSRYLATVCR